MKPLTLVFLTASLAIGSAAAQSPASPKPAEGTTVQSFTIKNAPSTDEANEIYRAVRNVVDNQTKTFLLPTTNQLVVEGTPDQIAVVQKVLNDIDKPRKTYRLTYTVSDFDGSKKLGSQRFSVTAVPRQRTSLKQGSRIPILTAPASATQAQFSYIDLGINFEATVEETGSGVRLNSSVEQSGVGEDRPGTAPQEPVIRQTSLKGSSFLLAGKPLTLGSIDIPGSTHHLDIEVLMEPIP